MLQQLILPPDCLHNLWVAVPSADRHNSRKGVKIAATGFVKEVLHLAFHDVELREGRLSC